MLIRHYNVLYDGIVISITQSQIKMDYRELDIRKGVINVDQEQKIRVLVIDADVLVRQLIARIIRNHQAYNIVGSSSMIDTAHEMIRQLEPDVLLIDVSSLRVNGVSEFIRIRKTYPLLPIILLSHRTIEDALEVMKGLELGAYDYITKPENIGMLLSAGNHFKKRVIPTIRAAVFGKKLHKDFSEKLDHIISARESINKYSPEQESDRIEAVVIGGCTGAPLAMYSLLSKLPEDFPVPIVVAQHMPKIYTQVFVSELGHKTKLEVLEAYSGAILEPGQIWVGPGGFHVTIQMDGDLPTLHIHRGPRENTCRPSIDVLFRSAARTFGSNLLAVVLSGRGIDGVAGCRAVKEYGGQIIVQDRKSAGAWELPGTVVHNKLADSVSNLDQVDKEIIKRVYKTRIRSYSVD